MPISVNPATHVITIPKSDTGFVSTNPATGYEVRSYDEYGLMRELANFLDSEAGLVLPNAFTHATQVTIAGIVYARSLLFLAPYTITFENGTYQVNLVGGTNNNLLDVLNPNSVSVISANSAGLQTVATSGGGGSSPTAAQIADEVMSRVIDGRFSVKDVLAVLLAPLAGKTAGVGTATEQYLKQNGTDPRITVQFDAQGNRTDIVIDPS